jgi:hypothetical protein
MAIDPTTVREHLAALPGAFSALGAALEDGAAAPPRPWLAGVPADDDAHHVLWAEVVGAVLPHLDITAPHAADALGVLARCPVQAAGDAVRGALGSPEADLRMLASDVVARSGRADALRLLEPLLTDPFFLVRMRVAGNFGVTGDPATLPLLRRALDDEDPMVRRWAAISFGELATPTERRVLHEAAEREEDALARDGLRRGLESTGAVDEALALHPLPEFARAARAAASGDEASLDWLLDHYRDRSLGVPVHLALTALDAANLPLLAERLRSSEPVRRFAAADVCAARGYSAARDELERLEGDMDVSVCVAASAGLMRFGEPSTISEYWLDRFPPLDRMHAAAALDLEGPVPDALVELLLFEPCGLIPRIGAELVRRQGGANLRAKLNEALALEHARIEGDAEPRPDSENDRFVMTRSARKRLVREGAALRSMLPDAVQAGAEELESEGFRDPHVIAALGLMLGLRGQAPDDARPALEPFLASSSPLLRFWALTLWVASHPTLPAPMDEDEHPTVRALWNAIAVRA